MIPQSTTISNRFGTLPGLLPTKTIKPVLSAEDTVPTATKNISIVPLSNNSQVETAKLSPSKIKIPTVINKPPTPKKLTTTQTEDRVTLATATEQIIPVKDFSIKTKPLVKQPVEFSNEDKFAGSYQDIMINSNLDKDLTNNGYTTLSKIIVKGENDERKTQYVKAINKKGQTVYVLIDTYGYTSSKNDDLTLMEVNNATVVPYSLKTGAFSCAGKEVSGIAFECGSDSICVLSHNIHDLTPIESNFVFVQQKPEVQKLSNTIMPYPIIKLSEIKVNPNLLLKNTDVVTRRLRNSSYNIELNAFNNLQQSLQKLNNVLLEFNKITQNAAAGLSRTLSQLDEWNEIYLSNPPVTDDAKDKYKRLQYNLSHRNQGISDLLRIMNKVNNKSKDIELISKEIDDLTALCKKEFSNVDYAISE